MNRTSELPRTPFTRSLRQKKCAECKGMFMPHSPTQKVCGLDCGIAYAANNRAKKDSRDRREGLAKLKTRSDWIRETQVEFNAYIRLRDQLAGYTCISSGLPLDWSGNNVDAGHYRSRGSAPHLRFNEDNCHAQSKKENRYNSGNAVDYRIGLIARIGLERVEAVESDDEPRKWTIDELKAIKATYRQKLKSLKEN